MIVEFLLIKNVLLLHNDCYSGKRCETACQTTCITNLIVSHLKYFRRLAKTNVFTVRNVVKKQKMKVLEGQKYLFIQQKLNKSSIFRDNFCLLHDLRYSEKRRYLPLKFSNPSTMSVPSSAINFVMVAPQDITSTIRPLSPMRINSVNNFRDSRAYRHSQGPEVTMQALMETFL